MALFRITCEKYWALIGEYWVNVYWATGASVDEFTAEVNGIVAAERPLYFPEISITKVRVDDGIKGSDVYRTYTVNAAGTNPNLDAAPVPAFVVGRVDFTASMGRPSRKYLRGCLNEADMNFTALENRAIARLQAYGDAIVNLAAIVDVDGQDFSNATVWRAPAMRQLRRGSKKRAPHNPMG